jgi:hypothetical protein
MVFFVFLLATSLSAQTQPQIFYVNVYEGIYPDIMNFYGANLTGATSHWTNIGQPGGRRASFTFDPVYYLAHNPDLVAAYGATGYAAAANHFITQGLPVEGRRGSLEFDVKYYLSHNSDLAAQFGTNYRAAADHFLSTGLPSQGRQGSADFNVKDYINNYPDVASGYGPTDYTDAMLHWLRRGKAFGRQGFGALPAPTDCGDGHTTEFATVPVAPAPPALPKITVAHAGAFVSNTSVQYVNAPAGFPLQLTAVGSNPAQGQYTVASGVYTFSAADAEAPLQISYTLTPIPTGYSRIFFNLRTDGQMGTGTMADPFNASANASVMDVTLRHISEQTGVVPNHENGNQNGNGPDYGPYNLIVCLNDTGTFRTLGMYDYVIAQFITSDPVGGHSLGDPDQPATAHPAGFTFNRNWHIHGKGMWLTTLQLSAALQSPTAWGFPANTALGRVLGSHGDDVGGVEVSDMTIDANYAGVRGSVQTNLEGIFLRGSAGGNYIHNIQVTNVSGETGIEAFPILIQTITNKSPLQNTNNQVKYVFMNNFATSGMCTGIAIDKAQTEVAYNVVYGWSPAGFGICNAYGGWDMDSSWFHDNFAFNNTPAGFLDDSLTNRNVTVEFNQIINPQRQGILVGGGGLYDYYTIQWNTIQIAQNNVPGILFNGNVVGATVTRNNITVSGTPSGDTGISFGGSNTGNVFQYNQIASRFGNAGVPGGNCVYFNWNENSVQLTNLPNTQSSPCAAPPQPYATMQTDGNFVIYGPAGDALWSTQTAGSGGAIIKLQDDGNLVIYSEVWQAGTYATPSPGPFPAASCSIGTALHAPQDLLANQCIVSPKGQYFLLMGSPAGPLFIYDQAHGVGTWGAPGSQNGGVRASLQSDGNFVVYNSSNVALWNSATYGTGVTLLDMEDDGRIILYRPVWSIYQINGAPAQDPPLPGPPSGPIPSTRPSCDVGTGTGWTGVLGPGQCFVSPNGRFELLLQTDGGLVELDRSIDPAVAPQAIWFQ